MGGTNPYIEKADVELPTKPYTVTFVKPDKTQQVVQVNPNNIPYGPTGLPGSILDIAMGAGIDLEHVCGGGVRLFDVPCRCEAGIGHL